MEIFYRKVSNKNGIVAIAATGGNNYFYGEVIDNREPISILDKIPYIYMCRNNVAIATNEECLIKEFDKWCEACSKFYKLIEVKERNVFFKKEYDECVDTIRKELNIKKTDALINCIIEKNRKEKEMK